MSLISSDGRPVEGSSFEDFKKSPMYKKFNVKNNDNHIIIDPKEDLLKAIKNNVEEISKQLEIQNTLLSLENSFRK